MANQIVNIGAAADDNTGDNLRNAFVKVNANTLELYTLVNATANGTRVEINPIVGYDAASITSDAKALGVPDFSGHVNIHVTDDGTKAYLLTGAWNTSNNGTSMYQATLSIPFDIASSTGWSIEYVTTGGINTQTGSASAWLSPDGTKLMLCNYDAVHEFDITTPFDISSGVAYNTSSSGAFGGDGVGGGTMSPDNAYFYGHEFAHFYDRCTLQQTTVGDPNDAGTFNNAATFDYTALMDMTGLASVHGITVNNDGTKLFLRTYEDDGNSYIREHTMNPPHDLSSLVLVYKIQVPDVIEPNTSEGNMDWNADGTKLYIFDEGDNSNDSILRQYSSTATNGGSSLLILHDNNEKLRTVGDGVQVLGNLSTSGEIVSDVTNELHLAITGGDTSGGLGLGGNITLAPGEGVPAGTILVHAPVNTIGVGGLDFRNDTDTAHTTGFSIRVQASASLAADVVLTLPITDGLVNEVLQTDGAGVLAWVALPESTSTDGDGTNSIAIGLNADANETSNISIGTGAISGQTGGGTLEVDAIAIGTGAIAYDTSSVAIGDGAVSGVTGLSDSPFAISIGGNARATALKTIAIGENTYASKNYTIAIGDTNGCYATHSIAIGTDAYARETNCVAIGWGSLAGSINGGNNEPDATAVGRLAKAYQHQCTAVGYNTTAGINGNSSQPQSSAFGAGSVSYGSGSLAMGLSCQAKELGSTAIGYGAIAGRSSGATFDHVSVAIGYQPRAYKQASIAIGWNAIAGTNTGNGDHRSIALGKDSLASLADSIAIGTSANATDVSSIAIGTGADANNADCIAIGQGSTATTVYSVSLGSDPSALGNSSIAIGNTAIANELGNISIGASVTTGVTPGGTATQKAIAIGYSTQATQSNSVAIGQGVINITANTVAIGTSNTNKMTLDAVGNFKVPGAIHSAKQSVTLGAAATTFAATSNFIVLTGDAGTNTLASITGGVDGQVIRILCVDGLVTITDTDAHTADTIDLSAAFTSADDTVLTLIYDGTSWYECGRSVN